MAVVHCTSTSTGRSGVALRMASCPPSSVARSSQVRASVQAADQSARQRSARMCMRCCSGMRMRSLRSSWSRPRSAVPRRRCSHIRPARPGGILASTAMSSRPGSAVGVEEPRRQHGQLTQRDRPARRQRLPHPAHPRAGSDRAHHEPAPSWPSRMPQRLTAPRGAHTRFAEAGIADTILRQSPSHDRMSASPGVQRLSSRPGEANTAKSRVVLCAVQWLVRQPADTVLGAGAGTILIISGEAASSGGSSRDDQEPPGTT